MTVREEIIRIVEQLPESDLLTLKRVLRGLAPEEPVRAPLSEEERQARVNALFGSLPRLPATDDFLRTKHEETERDEERLVRRQEGQAA